MNKKTISYNLKIVSCAENKKNRKILKLVGELEKLVSEYRLTAMKMIGTDISTICNKNANRLEKALREAINSNYSEDSLVLFV